MAHTEQISFADFRKRFADESSCKNYLYKLRFPNGFVCPPLWVHFVFICKETWGKIPVQ